MLSLSSRDINYKITKFDTVEQRFSTWGTRTPGGTPPDPRAGAANPGPAGHFWPAKAF